MCCLLYSYLPQTHIHKSSCSVILMGHYAYLLHRGCHVGNLRCSQWCKTHQHDDLSVSIKITLSVFCFHGSKWNFILQFLVPRFGLDIGMSLLVGERGRHVYNILGSERQINVYLVLQSRLPLQFYQSLHLRHTLCFYLCYHGVIWDYKSEYIIRSWLIGLSSPSRQHGGRIIDDNLKCKFTNENWLKGMIFSLKSVT